MTNELIERTLRELLRSIRPKADHDTLDVDGDFSQALGLDSLDVANFIAEAEISLSVKLEPDVLMRLNTLNKLVDFVATRSRAGDAPRVGTVNAGQDGGE